MLSENFGMMMDEQRVSRAARVVIDALFNILCALCVLVFPLVFLIGVMGQGGGYSLVSVSLWIGICAIPIGAFFGIRYAANYVKRHPKYYPYALGIVSIPYAVMIYFIPMKVFYGLLMIIPRMVLKGIAEHQ